jgi:MATE family multidrug resistance protein
MITSLPLRREAAALLRLAAPVVATQIGLVSMGFVDTIFVGRLGGAALGGMALGNSLAFSFLVVGLGVLSAVDTLVAQSYGAGERGECGAHLVQGLFVGLGLGLAATALFLRPQPLLGLLGQKPDVALAAADYLETVSWSFVPMMLFSAQRGFLNGIGKTRPFMVVTLVANLVNAAADWAMIYGHLGFPAMGVRGAGYATTGARLFMLAATTFLLARGGFEDFRPTSGRRPAWRRVARLLRIGLPVGGQFAAEVGIFATVAVFMGRLGKVPLAAHQIALQLASLTFMVPLGLSVGASVRVGQAIGRGAWEDTRVSAIVAYALGVGFMATSAAAFAVFAEPLAWLFTDDRAVVPVAAVLIRVAALFQLSDGAQVIGGGCLRGAADTRAAFVVNLIGHWAVGLPVGLALAFPAGLGARGLWYGLSASLTFVAVFLAARFISGRWRARLPARAAAAPAAAALEAS